MLPYGACPMPILGAGRPTFEQSIEAARPSWELATTSARQPHGPREQDLVLRADVQVHVGFELRQPRNRGPERPCRDRFCPRQRR